MPRRRALPNAALVAGVALLASACSVAAPAAGGGGHDHGRTAPPSTRATPRRAGPAWATGAPVRVVMNDRFRYRPASIMVRAGHRVTFAVHNAGKLPHEFILGDRATQLDHERQMQAMPAERDHMMHAHAHGSADHATGGAAGGLTVPPGETRRLTWTFHDPGIVLYGCHVLGHWAAGMRGTIVVLAPNRPEPVPALGPTVPGRPGRARRRISSSWLRAFTCWANRVAWMPWKRPSSQPTSWAWATRSSASLGVSSPTKGRATRPSSSARSGERLSDSSRTEMS